VYIVRPDLEPDALKAVMDRVAQRIRDQGGAVEAVTIWGKRRMSFAINKQREGLYVHARFSLDPQKAAEVRRLTALNDEVLRAFLTTAVGKLQEPVPPAPPATPPVPAGPSETAEA